MKPNDYLREVLKKQTLSEDSDELEALREARADVEALLKAEFATSAPTIRYGGSKAKGTMIAESYDLDIICYFAHDESDAGETLSDIYANVSKALQKKYIVREKTSALRLLNTDKLDFHIDVVPGRYTDDTKEDVFIYQKSAEKCRLKTNLNTHIEHIRDSGVTDAIRLMKLWAVRNALNVKTFILELMVIELLEGRTDDGLSDQLVHVFEELRDNVDAIPVEDPANPNGNDLSETLDQVRANLSIVAGDTLEQIESDNWEGVFGQVGNASKESRAALAAAAVSTVSVAAKPWTDRTT